MSNLRASETASGSPSGLPSARPRSLPREAGANPMTPAAWMDIEWREHLRWVRIQDRLVNVIDIGQGPVVIFLHGLAGCWQNWLETIPELARDHRVIAIDLPGFGASQMPEEPISIPGYARMLEDLFEVLAVDQCHRRG